MTQRIPRTRLPLRLVIGVLVNGYGWGLAWITHVSMSQSPGGPIFPAAIALNAVFMPLPVVAGAVLLRDFVELFGCPGAQHGPDDDFPF